MFGHCLELLTAILVMVVLAAGTYTARAEAYLVANVGVVGCKSREALKRVASPTDSGATKRQRAMENGDCTLVSWGERLVTVPEMGVGYSAALKFQRGTGEIIYVPTGSVIRDPACGTIANEEL